MLLKVLSYCFSSLFLFLHHTLNITTFFRFQWSFFSWEGGRDFGVMFSSNMYEQGLTGLAVYHRGIGREMLSLLSKFLIIAMLFYINFNFAASSLLCWGTRLHYKLITHSWEAHLCPPSHSLCLLWDRLWALSHSQIWWAKWPCPLVPWFVEYLWFVSPVGSGNLEDLKWASPLPATVPVVRGSAFSPPTAAGRGKASAASALLPGMVGGCEDCHHLLLLLHRQGREVWGGWVSWCHTGGHGVPPGRAALGTKPCSKLCRDLSPSLEVVHNMGEAHCQTPSLWMQIFILSGLKWGW